MVRLEANVQVEFSVLERMTKVSIIGLNVCDMHASTSRELSSGKGEEIEQRSRVYGVVEAYQVH